jgi:hypothetical protein
MRLHFAFLLIFLKHCITAIWKSKVVATGLLLDDALFSEP